MSAWNVEVSNRVWQQIREAPEQNRVKALHWILVRLPKNPLPETKQQWRGTSKQDAVDPLRSAQRGVRKGMHSRIGGKWRLIYVVTPRLREVFVHDCVEHIDDRLYSPSYVRTMLRASRKNPAVFA